MTNYVEVTEATGFTKIMDEAKSNGTTVVINFEASWHEPCKQMKPVFTELAKDTSVIKFLTVDAEQLADVAGQFPVQSVPTFVVTKGGKIVDTLEGASAPLLVAMVQKHAKAAQAKAKAVGAARAAAPKPEEINARLKKLVSAAPVMLFMKGDPEAPKCGFSKTLVAILKEEDVKFGYFDILTDDKVRQGLKAFSNWKTYPQLYVKGELLGGLDIVKEMKEDGELSDIWPKPPSQDDLNTRLKALVSQKPVMLFMKGDPDEPKCGFSRKTVELLREAGCKDFGHFDILSDNDVRQGLKAFSNWPTFPQVYVGGELQGGLDILLEMKENGELAEALGV